MTKKQDCYNSLKCLFLEVDASIANDIQQKVMLAIEEAENIKQQSPAQIYRVVSLIWELAQLNYQTDKTPFPIAKDGGRLKTCIDYLTNPEKYLGVNEGNVFILRPASLRDK